MGGGCRGGGGPVVACDCRSVVNGHMLVERGTSPYNFDFPRATKTSSEAQGMLAHGHNDAAHAADGTRPGLNREPALDGCGVLCNL